MPELDLFGYCLHQKTKCFLCFKEYGYHPILCLSIVVLLAGELGNIVLHFFFFNFVKAIIAMLWLKSSLHLEREQNMLL